MNKKDYDELPEVLKKMNRLVAKVALDYSYDAKKEQYYTTLGGYRIDKYNEWDFNPVECLEDAIYALTEYCTINGYFSTINYSPYLEDGEPEEWSITLKGNNEKKYHTDFNHLGFAICEAIHLAEGITD